MVKQRKNQALVEKFREQLEIEHEDRDQEMRQAILQV